MGIQLQSSAVQRVVRHLTYQKNPRWGGRLKFTCPMRSVTIPDSVAEVGAVVEILYKIFIRPRQLKIDMLRQRCLDHYRPQDTASSCMQEITMILIRDFWRIPLHLETSKPRPSLVVGGHFKIWNAAGKNITRRVFMIQAPSESTPWSWMI